jgi:hypothetical protein
MDARIQFMERGEMTTQCPEIPTTGLNLVGKFEVDEKELEKWSRKCSEWDFKVCSYQNENPLPFYHEDIKVLEFKISKLDKNNIKTYFPYVYEVYYTNLEDFKEQLLSRLDIGHEDYEKGICEIIITGTQRIEVNRRNYSNTIVTISNIGYERKEDKIWK